MNQAFFQWAEFRYGWASFILSAENGVFRCMVGDINDAPKILIDALNSLFSGSSRECFSFDHEPEEIRWEIFRTQDTLRASVTVFQNWGDTSGGDIEWEADGIDLVTFAASVYTSTKGAIEKEGGDCFRGGWPSFPPPAESLERLWGHLVAHGWS